MGWFRLSIQPFRRIHSGIGANSRYSRCVRCTHHAAPISTGIPGGKSPFSHESVSRIVFRSENVRLFRGVTSTFQNHTGESRLRVIVLISATVSFWRIVSPAQEGLCLFRVGIQRAFENLKVGNLKFRAIRHLVGGW